MKSLINLPLTKCFVRTKFVTEQADAPELISSYLIAVCVILNEAPKFMIMTDEGAAYCYIPPQAICFSSGAPEISLEDSCSWDCLADRGEIISIEFLEHWLVSWKGNQGRYLFSLHFDPKQAWGRDPEQLKVFHFIEGQDSNLYIKVNNQMRWICNALDQPEQLAVRPQSNKKIWYTES